MPYCPKCRNYIKDGRRVCESCGARVPESRANIKARKKARQKQILGIWIGAIIVIVLIAAIWSFSREDSGDTSSTEPSDSSSSTEPSATGDTSSTEPSDSSSSTEPSGTGDTVPSNPVESTSPSVSDGEYIGTLYTRDELEAMENESKGYGPGRTSGGARAPYAVSDQSRYEQYGANFIAPDDGNIYLTFDCGYEYIATDSSGNTYRVTEKILDVLKEKNVKAVFFVTMYYCKDQPDLVQRMIDEGHIVGNHSNNHPVMTSLTIDEMVYEIMSLHEYVQENFDYEMFLFRPPTGAYSTRTLAVVQSLGYKTVHWSFAYADYDTDNQPNVSSSLNLVTSSHHSGAIYLLHAISTTNASLLPDAIDFFRDQGYTIALFQ